MSFNKMQCLSCLLIKCGCYDFNQKKIMKLERTVVSLKNALARELALLYKEENLTPREVKALVAHMMATF